MWVFAASQNKLIVEVILGSWNDWWAFFTKRLNLFFNQINKRDNSIPAKARRNAINHLYKNSQLSNEIYENEDINFTSKDLYNTYLKMINNNEIAIIFEGDKDIYDSLSNFNSDVSIEYKKEKVELNSMEKGLIIEKDNTKQNNLFFIYDNFDDNANVKNFLFSMMLGEGANSLLFKEVREKHSLAYVISSSFNSNYQLLTISAGIQLGSLDKAIELINEQLNRLKNEDLTNLLNSAKENYISTLYSSLDAKGFLSNRCIMLWVYNKNKSFDDLVKDIKNVTLEDIHCIANKIQNKIMYVLQGDLENEKK